MAAVVEHTYRYDFESRLETDGCRPALRLAATSAERDPFFFRARSLAPETAARALSTLSRVVGSRFYVPPAMLAKILALADPVVTSGGGMLRFEGFSSCASAYARVDFDPDAFETEAASHGTTNVDFNAKMRATLASVRDRDGLELSVGRDQVAVTRGDETVVERKVALPVRWLKGFVEVQAYLSRMQSFAALPATDALRFLRALPKTASRQEQWLVRHGRGVRLAYTPAPGALRVGGVERLRVVEPLLPRCRELRIFADPDGQASAWQLELGGCRFTLAITADVWRGFSGEGQALASLRAARAHRALALELRAQLNWQAAISTAELARRFDAPEAAISAALATLGSRGLVGFDQHLAAFFHRELPFDLALVEALSPRLRAARELLDAGQVRISPERDTLILVTSGDVVHRVDFASDLGAACTCPWFAKHRGARGPCKHVLAAEGFLEQASERRSAR